MTSTASSLPTPISVSTSQNWDSDGAGLWSTFIVDVGTPPQPSRVIISTAGDETWVVAPAGCPSNYGNNCPSNRGGEFWVGNSTSWTNIGLFELDLELNIGYTGNGQYGHDIISLGYPGSGGPTLTQQVVAQIAAPDFFLGAFGLDPAPSNFTNLNDPQPSFLWTLANTSMIPSLSWAYTAGAAYRYDKVQGSLTLGGYDASRFDSKNITFDFYNDVARRYIVELTAITYIPTGVSTITTPTTLMSETLSMYIDSTIPYLYLPTDVCKHFENAFGLQWNDTTEIYTVNNTIHAQLQSVNPNITFSLTNTAGQTMDVILPYAAFDLMATFPVVSNDTNYFPLRRAINSTQYTFGRVFLQETYLIADFERSTFTLSQCIWPSTFKEDIRAILPPGNSTNNPTNTTIEPPKYHAPVGAIAGGVGGGVILIILGFLLAYIYVWKPRHKKRPATPIAATEDPEDVSIETVIVDPNFKAELDAKETEYKGAELDDDGELEIVKQEIGGTPIRGHELDTYVPAGAELDSPQVFEMPAMEPVGCELQSPSSPVISPMSFDGQRDDVNMGRRHDTYYNP